VRGVPVRTRARCDRCSPGQDGLERPPHSDADPGLPSGVISSNKATIASVCSWSHNEQWLRVPRRIVEAYFHARWFLDVAIRYGEKDDEGSGALGSGWAALLELYGIR